MARAVLLLVALVLALPPAAADHAWSHRVVVEGRVVDEAGVPAAGVALAVTLEGADAQPCFDAPAARTGPMGDYTACLMVGPLAPEAELVARVAAGGAEASARVDPLLRRGVANLQLEGPAPGRDLEGARQFARTLLVEGRVFTRLARPVDVDGVEVHARPVPEANVSVRLLARGVLLAEGNATVDDAGDYALLLAVDEVPAGAYVEVETHGHEGLANASALHRRADGSILVDLRPPDLENAPGSTTPLPWGWSVAALAAAGLARLVTSGAGRSRRR